MDNMERMEMRREIELLKAQVAELDRRIEAQDDGAEPPMRVEAGNGIDVQEVGGAYRVDAKGEPEALLPFDVRLVPQAGAGPLVQVWIPDPDANIVSRNAAGLDMLESLAWTPGEWNTLGSMENTSQVVVVKVVPNPDYVKQEAEQTAVWEAGSRMAARWTCELASNSFPLLTTPSTMPQTWAAQAVLTWDGYYGTGGKVQMLRRGALHTWFPAVDSDPDALNETWFVPGRRSLSYVDENTTSWSRYKMLEIYDFFHGGAPRAAPGDGRNYTIMVRVVPEGGGPQVAYEDFWDFLAYVAAQLKVTVGGTDYDVKVK